MPTRKWIYSTIPLLVGTAQLHEWNIASGIVESLIVLQRDRKARVLQVEVGVGQLSGIEVEILRYALETLSGTEALKGVNYIVKIREGRFKCSRCGNNWDLKDSESELKETLSETQGIGEPDGIKSPLHFFPQLITAFVRCPKCGSSDMEVVDGMDTVIEGVDLEGE